ncbi:S8 family serine peptidase [Dactylosporangium sp. NPDC050688]|uniref:S8 family serine peptidase n=1 Tax=Dactylosporangium sp. NPDC050688 TaxID=3157217 RepID=UPI00340D4CC6
MRRRGWSMAAAVVTGLLAVPLPAAAGQAEPVPGELPALPNPAGGCVPASSTVQRGQGWAQARMAAPTVWPLTAGDGVTVAVLDTGVSPAAPALAGAVLAGVDVVGPGRGDSDCLGRGSFLAGLVAGRPVAGTDFAGVAPAATILPVRVTDARGKLTADTIAAGLRAAVTGGARVVLIATSVPASSVALRDAVDLAVSRDVVVVAAVAAGSGTAAPPVDAGYPARYAPVLAVAGVSPGGGLVERSAPADLVAPGDDAVSVGPSGTGHYTGSGNGVAAAYVAGAAALVRSYHPALPAAEVARRLTATAAPLTAAGTGAGLVDGYDAVAAVEVGAAPGVPPAGSVALPGVPARPAAPGRALTVTALLLIAVTVTVVAVTVTRIRRRLPG